MQATRNEQTPISRKYYDEFSQTYEDQRHRGYHRMLDDFEVAVARPYCRNRVLEAGCGTGLILSRLAAEARHAVGIDLSAGMLRRARSRGLGIGQASIDRLPFPDASFDAVVSFKVLAHIPGIQDVLHELARITRPGGHLVLEFYNRASLRYAIKRLKRPTRIGQAHTDEDVYTRFDSLEDIHGYLPPSLKVLRMHGLRVFTPVAMAHDLPAVGPLLRWAEERALNARVLSRFAGFLIVILQKA